MKHHDVRMTPDKTLAVVTCENALSFIDLTVIPPVPFDVAQADHRRLWRETADSVALTNDNAVTIASLVTSGNPTTVKWKIDVWDIQDVPAVDHPAGHAHRPDAGGHRARRPGP